MIRGHRPNPPEGPHATGAAADLTLCTVEGAPLWMGSVPEDAQSPYRHTADPGPDPVAACRGVEAESKRRRGAFSVRDDPSPGPRRGPSVGSLSEKDSSVRTPLGRVTAALTSLPALGSPAVGTTVISEVAAPSTAYAAPSSTVGGSIPRTEILDRAKW
ncbi:hypothetical protein [Streptomyces sp. Wb2n-11]|uniref:hypothetical protein n=1 Tax=Streptomyces sp. Wb2n-11 TaxID=1030533 RepID=UPI000A803FD2|nr:hypothetical protein [Streptomyces sp. Wb2n-11]